MMVPGASAHQKRKTITMSKVAFRGYTLDDRTAAMIVWAEKKAGFKFNISQGSYNVGGVTASAGTHDGGGCVDFSVKKMTLVQQTKMLIALKDAGFAAWHRSKNDGFDSEHVHAVAIGCLDLAPLAKWQVGAYDARKDGLKVNKDDHSYRPKPRVKFSMVLKRPVPRLSK